MVTALRPRHGTENERGTARPGFVLVPYSARIDSLGPWLQLMRGSTPVRAHAPNVFAVKGILLVRTVNSMSAPHSWSLGRGAAILYPASPLDSLKTTS